MNYTESGSYALENTDTTAIENPSLYTPPILKRIDLYPPTPATNARLNTKNGQDLRQQLRQKQTFLAIVRKRDNIEALLESITLGNMLSHRNKKSHLTLIIHHENQQLAQACDLFDEVLPYQNGDSLRKYIQFCQPSLLYIPQHDLNAHLSSSFVMGSKTQSIGFGEQNLLTRWLRIRHINQKQGLLKLKKRGYELQRNADLPSIKAKIRISQKIFPNGNYIWLSLFEDHALNNHWPIAYAARLIRLLGKHGITTVVSVPHTKNTLNAKHQKQLIAQVKFLKKNTRTLYIVEGLSPQERACGMQQALAVAGPAGPDTSLALLLRRPLVVLHDMRSHNMHTNKTSKEKVHGNPEKVNFYGDKKVFWKSFQQASQQASQRAAMQYITSPHLQQHHIMPTVDECIEHCVACQYSSCVEYISPEHVFENLKKILFPF